MVTSTATTATLGIKIDTLSSSSEDSHSLIVSRLRNFLAWDVYATSFLEQLFYLSHRNFINIIRSKEIFLVRLAVILILTLVIGTMYLQIV